MRRTPSPSQSSSFVLEYQLATTTIKDLFELLTTRDHVEGDGLSEGHGFEAGDMPKNAEHFFV